METTTFANYIGKNLKNIITDVRVVQGTSKDSGKLYYYIELLFINGYKKVLFLKSDEAFAWLNAMQTLDVSSELIDNI